MIPLPSELILPYAGLPRLRPDARSSRSPASPGTSGSWSIVATIGNTLGSLDRLRHRRVRRPAVPRALRQVPAHPAARDRAGRPVLRRARRGDRVLRPAAADRPDVHQLPGRRRPDADLGKFIVYSTAGAFLWSMLLVYAGTVLGANWVEIRARAPAVRPRDRGRRRRRGRRLFIWWRLGMPGWRRSQA